MCYTASQNNSETEFQHILFELRYLFINEHFISKVISACHVRFPY